MSDLPVTSGLFKITKYLTQQEIDLAYLRDYAEQVVRRSLINAISEIILSDTRERVVRSLGTLRYPNQDGTTTVEAGALVLLLLPQEAKVGEYVSCERMPRPARSGILYVLQVFTGKGPELYDTFTFEAARFGTSEVEVEAWKRVA